MILYITDNQYIYRKKIIYIIKYSLFKIFNLLLKVSLIIKGRSGKQCRERWFNNLNPNVKKGNWTAEEDQIIFQQY